MAAVDASAYLTGCRDDGASPAASLVADSLQKWTAMMITHHTWRCQGCRLRFACRRELRRHRREAHWPIRPPAIVRLARALRAVHREQVYAMECLLRPSQLPTADPLTWVTTPSGYQLVGCYLLAGIKDPRERGGR
jgi:hypothetical protein